MSVLVPLVLAAIGWIGALSSVSAYALVTAKRVESDSWTFQGLNLLGASMLSVSASVHGAWPSAVVNIVWVAIGLFALRALVQHRRRTSA